MPERAPEYSDVSRNNEPRGYKMDDGRDCKVAFYRAEYLPGRTDASREYRKVIVYKHGSGGFKRKADSAQSHRDADIRGGKCRSIVDAVADHRYFFTFFFICCVT